MRVQNIDEAIVETVVDGLTHPWAFEFLSSDEILLTEHGGRMLRIHLVTGERIELGGLPEIATQTEQAGLLDVALYPDFDKSRRIAFSHVQANAAGNYFATVVQSAVLESDRLTDLKTLVPGHGRYTWSPSNFGGSLAFGPDGKLFIGMGDRSDTIGAQNGRLLSGKILRLNGDGTIPADNPFIDVPEIDDRIWALGVRNPQGLYFDAKRDRLFEAEHGPNGGDEVNVITRGANYGWPIISYGRHYTPGDFGFGPGETDALMEFHLATAKPTGRTLKTEQQGLEQPLFYYTPSIAISPLAVVSGPMFPEWEGHVLLGALKGMHVSKLDVKTGDEVSDDRVLSEVAMLDELASRIRDIQIAADGSIWILTQTTGLHRLFRDPALMVDPGKPRTAGQSTYEIVCSGCHNNGSGGAQMFSDPDAWQDVLARPREEVYRRVIEGFGGMPERGSCYRCGDELLKETVDWMLKQLSNASEKSDDE